MVILIWFLAAIVLHEAAHLLMALFLGIRLKFVLFCGLSLDAQYACHGLKEVILALAGPLANLLAAAFFMVWEFNIAYQTNLLVAFVNLLPILPLDGGRVLRGIGSKYVSWLRLTKILASLGQMVACCIAAAAVYFTNGGAFWWLLFAAYLFYLSYVEKLKAPYVLTQALLLGNNKGFGQRIFRFPAHKPLREAVYCMSPGWHNLVRVNGMEIDGEILIRNWLHYERI